MFYRIVAGEDIFDLNPGLRAVPVFKDMTDMQMKYVCFMCDTSFDNPVRTLLGKKRKEESARLAGYKMENTGNRLDKQGRDIVLGYNDTIENAILQFKKLHYDEKTDTYETLLNQIGEIRDYVKMNKRGNVQRIKHGLDLGLKLPALIEARKKLEQLLGIETGVAPVLSKVPVIEELSPPVSEPEEEDNEDSLLEKYHHHNKRIIN